MARKDALQNLRDVLVKRRDALRMAIAGDFSLLKELEGQSSSDVIDAALDTAQDEISSRLAEVESRELASIENAIQRMDAGEYGRCEHCNCNIPLARLQALPYATYCIDCQRQKELLSRGGGSTTDWGRIIDAPSTDDIRLSDFDINVP